MPWDVTAHPTAPWVWQPVIHATPGNTAPQFLIRDRDRNDGGDFVRRAARLGIRPVLPPVQAPQANAIAERVVRTFRQECLDHVIVLNDRHLRRVLREFVLSGHKIRIVRQRPVRSDAGGLPASGARRRARAAVARAARLADGGRGADGDASRWHRRRTLGRSAAGAAR